MAAFFIVEIVYDKKGDSINIFKEVSGGSVASGIAMLTCSVAGGYIGATGNFWVAVVLLMAWAMVVACVTPIRQAYLNGIIPSEQRATVLSFDSLMGSSGAFFSQPALGRVADVGGYSASYLVTSSVQLGALPFAILACRQKASSDPIE